MPLVLGLDAGNTKTLALLAGLDGAIVGSGRGGCGDIYGAGSPEAALVQIEAALAGAFACAGLSPDLGSLAAACGSMAGADWPEDFELLRRELEARGLRRNLSIYNDAFGALRAGSPDGFGVAVACGTGTATGARAPDGRLWHTSYWQGPQGALELAQLVLEAVYRAELGLDPPTSLTGRVLAFFKLPDVEQVLHQLTARPPRPSAERPGLALGPLARVLLDEAHAGDPTALTIAQRHGAALGDYALVAARHVGLGERHTPFTLVLAGGVLRHPTNVLKAALIERVRAAAPGVQPVVSRFEPVVGAVLLALEAAGIRPDEPVLERLSATLPPAALFAT
jgi:N-acetylglucosamine kinase-like BadF-type ATPase